MNILKAGLMAFGLVIGTMAVAQEREGGKSPQERAQFKTDWMAKELSLSEEQKTKVAGLNLALVEKNQGVKNNTSLTEAQKKEAWSANRKAQREELKSILTAEQLAALKAKKEQFKSKHKGNGKHHAEHKAKTAEERAKFRTDEMAKQLSLTEEQKTKVAALNLAAVQKNETIRKDASLNEEQKKAAFKTAHEEQVAKLNEVLTPEQQATLKAKKQNHCGSHHGEKSKK